MSSVREGVDSVASSGLGVRGTPALPPSPTADGKRRSIHAVVWPEAAFLIITTAAGLWARGRWVNSFGDPGFTWSAVHRVAHGEAPYRDIFLSYTPLSLEMLALATRLFGESVLFWTLVNWIAAVLCGLVLLVSARRHLGSLERLAVAAVFMALSLFVTGDGRLVYPYYSGVTHAALLSLGALLFLHEGTWSPLKRGFCAGLLAGLAFGCKQEIGVAAIAAVLVPVVTRPRQAFAWIVGAVAGGGVAFAATGVFLLSAGSLESLRTDNRFWPLILKPAPDLQRLFRAVAGLHYPGWVLGLRAAAFSVFWQSGLLLLVAALIARSRDRASWLRLAGLFGALAAWWLVEGFELGNPSPAVCLSMLVSFSVALIALLRPAIPGRTFLVGLGVFSGLAGVRTAFSPFSSGAYDGPGRLAASLTWVVFLCVLLPELFLANQRARQVARSVMAAAILLAAAPRVLDGIRSLRFEQRTQVATRRGNVFVTPSQARVLALLSRSLVAGERAVLIPESNAADVLFGVRNISPLVDLMPGWVDARMDQELAARFERESPDVVVLFDRSLTEYGLAPFGRGYGRRLADWCARRYVVVDECPEARILRPRGAPAAPDSARPPVF